MKIMTSKHNQITTVENMSEKTRCRHYLVEEMHVQPHARSLKPRERGREFEI